MIRTHWKVCVRVLAGLLILAGIIAGLFIMPIFMARINPRQSESSEVFYIALFVLRVYLFNYLACFVALALSGHLVHDDFFLNTIDAFLTPVLVLFHLSNMLSWRHWLPDVSLGDKYHMSVKASFLFWTTWALLNSFFIYVLVKAPHFGPLLNL